MNWIKPTDRLPKDGEQVRILCKPEALPAYFCPATFYKSANCFEALIGELEYISGSNLEPIIKEVSIDAVLFWEELSPLPEE